MEPAVEAYSIERMAEELAQYQKGWPGQTASHFAGGGATVNEVMLDLSTKVAPVSMKTGTGERVPRAALSSAGGLL